MRSSPEEVLGTSSVKVAGPRCARSRTQPSRAGVAAVRLATTSTRAGWAEDSIRRLLFGRAGRSGRVYAGCRPLVKAAAHGGDAADHAAAPRVRGERRAR